MGETSRQEHDAIVAWVTSCLEQFPSADYAEADIDELIPLRRGRSDLARLALRLYADAVAEAARVEAEVYVRLAVPVDERHDLGVGSRIRFADLLELDDFSGRLRGKRLPNFLLSRETPVLAHSTAGEIWRTRIDLSGHPRLTGSEAAFVVERWDDVVVESHWEIESFPPRTALREARVALLS